MMGILIMIPQFPVPKFLMPGSFYWGFGKDVEPRWGSIIWVIGNPACAARRWALELNAVGVNARNLNRLIDDPPPGVACRNVGEAYLAPTNRRVGKPALR